jgi:hypothetical protein
MRQLHPKIAGTQESNLNLGHRQLPFVSDRLGSIATFNGQPSRRPDWACNRRLHGLGRAIEDAPPEVVIAH